MQINCVIVVCSYTHVFVVIDIMWRLSFCGIKVMRKCKKHIFCFYFRTFHFDFFRILVELPQQLRRNESESQTINNANDDKPKSVSVCLSYTYECIYKHFLMFSKSQFDFVIIMTLTHNN